MDEKIRIFLRWFLFLSLCHFNSVSGYSSGAPDSQCGSLTPGHGFDSEDITTAPFTVQVDKTSMKTSDTLKIQIKTTGPEFLGYMVQVRDGYEKVVGEFMDLSGGRSLECSNKQDTTSHSSSAPKTSVTLVWKPKGLVGTNDIQVYATVVEEYSKYYVKMKSATVGVRGPSARTRARIRT